MINVSKKYSWNVIGASVRGSSHERNNIPNEDALAFGSLPHDGAYAILSDGHGSKLCFRSKAGATLAVQNVEKILEEPDVTKLLKNKIDQRKFAKRIVEQWNNAVLQHLKTHPFSRQEVYGLDGHQKSVLRRNALLAYGATLILVVTVGQEVFMAQLGDGDVLIIEGTGAISRVFKPDQRHMGNATTSLCLPNAVDEFRIKAWHGHPPLAIMASTDGYANSFRSEADFHKVLRDYTRMIDENGGEVVEKKMSQWLGETSHHGSGDDITVAILMR